MWDRVNNGEGCGTVEMRGKGGTGNGGKGEGRRGEGERGGGGGK